MRRSDPPLILGISGWSGSGKTTLIEKLIPSLEARGISPAVIKHDVHGIDPDEAGKDSARFKDAGAVQIVLCGPDGPSLNEALKSIKNTDIILVEGFKDADITRIGIARKENDKGFPAPISQYSALVTDIDVDPSSKKIFTPDDIDEITDYIISLIYI